MYMLAGSRSVVEALQGNRAKDGQNHSRVGIWPYRKDAAGDAELCDGGDRLQPAGVRTVNKDSKRTAQTLSSRGFHIKPLISIDSHLLHCACNVGK